MGELEIAAIGTAAGVIVGAMATAAIRWLRASRQADRDDCSHVTREWSGLVDKLQEILDRVQGELAVIDRDHQEEVKGLMREITDLRVRNAELTTELMGRRREKNTDR